MAKYAFYLFPALLLLSIASLVSRSLADEEWRHWQDATGRFSLDAQLIRVEKDVVHLRSKDGREIPVPISRLGQPDQQFLRSYRKTIAEETAAKSRPQFGETATLIYELGVEVSSPNGPCQNLTCGFPLPKDWPEQTVTILDRAVDSRIRNLKTYSLGEGVDQVRFTVSRLPQGDSARVVFTVQVDRKKILPPQDVQSLRIPKTIPAALRKHIGESPYIETRHPMVRREADQLTLDEKATAWEQVRAIRDHTFARVKYTGVKGLKGALQGLIDGGGDCEERTSLFVALCRNKGIPARCVWIPGHTYAEFYLEDEHGNGSWYPCESVGPQFGEHGNQFIVMQKGDSFRDPLKGTVQRYVSETLKGSLGPGDAAPVLKPIKEVKKGVKATGSDGATVP